MSVATTSPDVDGLAKPLFPRCGVRAFGEPQVVEIAEHGGWRLVYTHPAAQNAPDVKGVTTTINIDERPPGSKRVSYAKQPGARVLRVRGLKVDFAPAESADAFSAQWVTKRARYSVLADGSGQIVRKLVRCVP